MLDPHLIKKDFPILNKKILGNTLVYIDNAATTQKPQCVIDKISEYYSNYNANVHRGIHTLSELSSEQFENVRKQVALFIGSKTKDEIIFTSGTTASLNLVAFGWGINNLKENDEILTTYTEHHSNLVPWQELCKRTGAKLKFMDLNSDFEIDLNSLKESINKKTKLITLSHSSNVLGTIQPIKEICKIAKENNIKVCVDGAQSTPHFKVNMQSLGCNFYAFSAHKMLGPTGLGVLYVDEITLKETKPMIFGGGMIDEVGLEASTYTDAPLKFEAGTPMISEVIGFGESLKYLESVGMNNIFEYEADLTKYVLEKLSSIPDIHILGTKDPKKRECLFSFTIDNIHAHDIASVLSGLGVAVRSGHHCAMPLHKKLNIPASVRASFYFYNTKEDVDALIDGIYKTKEIFK